MIKLLIFLLSFSSAFACNNTIPISEAIKAINLEPNAGSKSCTDLPNEECYCYDGIQWETAELVTVIEQDELGINVEKKVLKESPVKKEQHIANLEKVKQKEIAKKAAKESLKEVDIEGANTVAKLKAIVKALIEAQE